MLAAVDRFLVFDPQLERLRMAARAMASILLAGALLFALSKAGIGIAPVALLGALVAMMGSLQANDPKPDDRKLTAALLILPAAAALALDTFLDGLGPVWGALGFLLVAYPAVWARRFGPRGFGLGMMALFVTFFSLFLKITVAQLPVAFVAITVGCASAWIARFVLVTDSPRLPLRAANAAFRAQLRLVVAATLEILSADTADPAERVRRQLTALNKIGLGIDRLAAGDAFELDDERRCAIRGALLHAELAAAALAERAFAYVRRSMPGSLENALRSFARGHVDAARSAATAPAAVGDELAAALLALCGAEDRARQELDELSAARLSGKADAPAAPGARAPDIGGLPPTTRQAIQVTLASGLAMVLGSAVPPHEYFWAVLTAFLVYNQTASAAEARRRSFARTGGTVVGVAAGFALLEVTRGKHPLEIGLAFVFLFLAMYTFRVSYLAFTFFITAIVAMLYDVAGRPTEQLLFTRLIETLVGAICGGAVATLVLPLKTRAVVAVRAKEFADGLRASVAASVDRLKGVGDARPLDASRTLDAQMQEVIERVRPLLGKPRDSVAGRATLEAICDCGYRARDLAWQALESEGRGDDVEGGDVGLALDAMYERVESALNAFQAMLDGGRPWAGRRRRSLRNLDGGRRSAAVPAARAPDALHDLQRLARDVAGLATAARSTLGP